MRSVGTTFTVALAVLLLVAAAAPLEAQPPKARTYLVALTLNQGPGATYPLDSTLFDCWRFTRAGNLVPRYNPGSGWYAILETVGTLRIWQGEVRYNFGPDGRAVVSIAMATAEAAFAGSSIAGTARLRFRDPGEPWFSANAGFAGMQMNSLPACLAAVEDLYLD